MTDQQQQNQRIAERAIVLQVLRDDHPSSGRERSWRSPSTTSTP